MSKIIESIDYFPAGYCTSYTGLLFKKVKNKKMTFPAGVFLIKHRDKGYLLYDTGYHYDIKTKLRYGLDMFGNAGADDRKGSDFKLVEGERD